MTFGEKAHLESKLLAVVCTKFHTFQLTKSNKDVTFFLVDEGVEGDIDSPATGQLDNFVIDEPVDDELAENEPIEGELAENEEEIEDKGEVGEPTSESQAALYGQGVGVHKVIAAQLFQMFPEKEMVIEKITASTEIYMKHLQSAPSLHSLVSAIVHHVVSPLLVARKLRGGQSTGNLKTKVQLAWIYILDCSQKYFPPYESGYENK